jgi:ring-1,2-phenylacetyl-CoA epoxidase subunit PaaE
VYGNKARRRDIQQRITRFTATCRSFFIHSVFSQAVEHALFGRIDKSTVNYVMNNKHKELEFDKFYLCGPRGSSSYWCFEKKKRKRIGYKI